MNIYDNMAAAFAELCGGTVGHGSRMVMTKGGSVRKRFFGGGCIRRGTYTLTVKGSDLKKAMEELSECAEKVCGYRENGVFSVMLAESTCGCDERGIWTCSAEITADIYDGGDESDGS